MSALILVALALGLLLAWANGANDVSKGVATLVGSGVGDLRGALRWGALCTAAGGLCGIALGGAMLSTFGQGLLAPGTTPSLAAALATLLGAGAWVLLATRFSLPVSTTHALVGALAGAGLVAYGPRALAWGEIGGKIALPLLLSPLASISLTALLARVARRPGAAADCVCAGIEPSARLAALSATGRGLRAVDVPARLLVQRAPSRECARGGRATLRLTLDHLHWLSSGAASFARGLNDGPKMAALVLGVVALSDRSAPAPVLLFAVVTLGMVGGSLMAGRRVTRVLAERVTAMDHREGLAANLVTSVLVTAGAVGGLPMSTTHVSSAAILGLGVTRGVGEVRWDTVRAMLLAWVVTLPAAAALAALATWSLR